MTTNGTEPQKDGPLLGRICTRVSMRLDFEEGPSQVFMYEGLGPVAELTVSTELTAEKVSETKADRVRTVSYTWEHRQRVPIEEVELVLPPDQRPRFTREERVYLGSLGMPPEGMQ